MKNIFALLTLPLLLLSTQSVSAESPVPRQAHIIFGEQVYLGNTDNEIAQNAFVVTRVNNYGELSVTIQNGQGRSPKIIKKLGALNANYLRTKIVDLSNVNLKTTYSEAVCMMMPPEAATDANYGLRIVTGIDHQTHYSNGSARLILTNTGCWSPKHIAPSDEYSAQEALELRAVLRALRNEALEEQK